MNSKSRWINIYPNLCQDDHESLCQLVKNNEKFSYKFHFFHVIIPSKKKENINNAFVYQQPDNKFEHLLAYWKKYDKKIKISVS